MSRPLVVAHRGGAGLAPENTLSACARALQLGVDAIEVDVRLTRDGVPWVLHDATLDRTTTGHGALAEHLAANLATLDASGPRRGRRPPEPPPSLAQVVALVRGRAALHVELKGDPAVPPALVAAVVAALRDQSAGSWTALLSFDWPALDAAHALAPGIGLCALAREWPAPPTLAHLSGEGIAWLGVRHRALTAARVRAARDRGLRVGAWTVDTRPGMHRAVRLGVDAITTDWPDRLQALLAGPDGTPHP
jgi:glycerophosphoryl diester phosphodiesterase